MGVAMILAAVLAASGGLPGYSDDLDDDRLIDLRALQKTVCEESDGESPDTWMARGRRDAFASVLAARGMCLDAGQGLWRVGNAWPRQTEESWRCSLVTS